MQSLLVTREGGTPLALTCFDMLCSEDEAVLVRSLYLLTMKPMIYAANVAEGDMADRGASSSFVQALKVKADEDKCEVVVISAQVGDSESDHKVLSVRPELESWFGRDLLCSGSRAGSAAHQHSGHLWSCCELGRLQ